MRNDATTMRGVRLPGDSTVDHVEVPIPQPGVGQVLVKMRASSICGSDIRAIYREHLGVGAEAYQGVIAGHEPCGEVVEVGPGVVRLSVGDRVVIYHIRGCGLCQECRKGYHIGCQSPERAAYGWQRDGGHAEYLLADEVSCLQLPDSLSFVDGALVSCGFGTAYEGLLRGGASGRDSVLVTGLGPVGLATAMLARHLGAGPVIGVDPSQTRVKLAQDLGLTDIAVTTSEQVEAAVSEATKGRGVELALDCSGNSQARLAALTNTRTWGHVVFMGEGSTVTFDVSPILIHQQLTLHGSWVTSLGHMAELLDLLDRWGEHPERITTHQLPLHKAAQAYQLADAGDCGKVCLVFD